MSDEALADRHAQGDAVPPPRSDSAEELPAEPEVDAPARRGGSFWKHNKRFKRFRRNVVYYLAYLPVTTAISWLPLGAARLLGKTIGTIAYFGSGRQRRRALENLEIAFPERSLAERKRIARGSFANASTVFTESLVIARWPLERIEARFHLSDSMLEMDRICVEGAVGITAHYGNWELLGGFFALYRPGKLAAGAARHSNPRIQESLEKKRRAWKMEVVYSDDSPRAFLRALKRKMLLGLLPDQNLRSPNGTFVPFFNRPAYTTTLPAHLARTTKKPLFVCLLRREGSGFRMLVFPPIDIDWSDDRTQDLHEATAAYTRILEDEFRDHPEQWVWFHDRWRTRPGDELKYSHVRWTRSRKS